MKKDKRIKVFLGGYINSINAQNLNCRSLAMHLDKNKFEVGAMIYPGGRLPMKPDFDVVKRFKLLCKLYRPLRFVRYINYLRGILWCDVAYLPKGEIFSFCQKIAKLLKKKTFITVEGVITGDNLASGIKAYGSEDAIRQLYNGYNRTYSITHFLGKENKKHLGIETDGILYLGVETETFRNPQPKKAECLKNIIFVGSNLKHKRIHEYLELAAIFPELTFNIAGDPGFADEVKQSTLPNVKFHGRLPHDELAKLLGNMDIHIFTSKSEGFPKVTLETAAAGVPSIVYGDYGADEWITTSKDGYVVNTFEEIVDIIKDLQSHPEKLKTLSENAIEMAKRFDWKTLIKDWEAAIVGLYNEK